VVRRQLGQLDTPVDEEGVVGDEETVVSLAGKRRERSIDLANGAHVENLDVQAHGASSRPRRHQPRRPPPVLAAGVPGQRAAYMRRRGPGQVRDKASAGRPPIHTAMMAAKL
jgi:hypothetical protein